MPRTLSRSPSSMPKEEEAAAALATELRGAIEGEVRFDDGSRALATHTHCTLGGMIGNNSCGVHSVMAGKTDDNVEERCGKSSSSTIR